MTKMGRKGRLTRLLKRIATERTTPGRTGLAVGLGILIGTTPFFGFHLAICLVVASLLGLNRAITYLAANISVPWIAPFLVFGSLQLGSLVLHGAFMPLTLASLRELDPWRFGSDWVVGALVLGVALGAPAGVAAFLFTRAYRRRHPLPHDSLGEQLRRAAEPYAELGRFTLGYVRGKLRYDPAYRQLAERLPLAAPVLDVGCGRGQTLVLLASLQPGLSGEGFDWDEPKLEIARRAARNFPGLRFSYGDIRERALAPAGTILMLDVLHYNPAPVQDEMLRRAAGALAPGGVLYVRDVDAARGWRARVNEWQERVGCFVRFNRGATLCFRPATDLASVLSSEGLEVTVAPSWADLPLANVLIEARRPAALMYTRS